MIEKSYAVIAFVGVWMLFSFPLYQGALELSEPNRILAKFIADDERYPKISPWYWVFPPLKINLEKKRGIKILQENIEGVSQQNELYRYFNKAVGWFYIAIAGLLNGLVVTHDLIEKLGWSIGWLGTFVIDLMMVAGGVIHVMYRFNPKRQENMMKRLFPENAQKEQNNQDQRDSGSK